MIRRILGQFFLCLLRLRYRIRVHGLKEILARGNTGILFLPNHPAMIDPIILMALLLSKFAPRPLADSRQMDRFIIRRLARWIGARPLPDAAKDGRASTGQIQRMLAHTIDGLNRGENALLYPSGHLTRARLEDLGGNSAVESLINGVPSVRLVLVRTRGLWGSSFSYANSRELSVRRILWKGLWSLLANGLFFGPRRLVDIELHEPTDLPRTAGRSVLNRYLERFYNQDAPPNTYIPCTFWKGVAKELPEPRFASGREGDLASVPAATRQLVAERLRELSGVDPSALRDEDRLANDLGLDSLSRVELIVWLEKEFGFPQSSPDALQTVGQVMLAACGEAVSSSSTHVKPPPRLWFEDAQGNQRVRLPEDDTITSVFLRQAARGPGRAAIADAVGGVKTYRDLITAILILQPILRKLPGQYLGIMLPASVTADVLFLATLFAGKTPVMVNWTVGRRNMLHSLDLLGVRHVLTAGALVQRLEAEGIDLEALKERFVLMETMRKSVSLASKVGGAMLRR